MWHRVGGFLFFIIPVVKQFSFHVEMELHLDFIPKLQDMRELPPLILLLQILNEVCFNF